jgi:6-phosphogluconolactonase/glucosamine-6-phosphate isomerase/deaminase
MKIRQTTSVDNIAGHIVNSLERELGYGRRAVFFVSGGSTIPVAVEVRNKLKNTKGLSIMQVDERFGDVGHENSNWQQLLDAGLNTSGVTTIPTLAGKDFEGTRKDFEIALHQALGGNHFVIGLFGIGTDGHTAGILPHSAAVTASSLASGYEGPDYQRLTITPRAIELMDEAIVWAAGDNKKSALEALQTDLSVDEQPAQVLKKVKSLTIYTDQSIH